MTSADVSPAEIRQRQLVITRDIEILKEQRARAVLASMAGDAEAAQTIAVLDGKLTSLGRDHDSLNRALTLLREAGEAAVQDDRADAARRAFDRDKHRMQEALPRIIVSEWEALAHRVQTFMNQRRYGDAHFWLKGGMTNVGGVANMLGGDLGEPPPGADGMPLWCAKQLVSRPTYVPPLNRIVDNSLTEAEQVRIRHGREAERDVHIAALAQELLDGITIPPKPVALVNVERALNSGAQR